MVGRVNCACLLFDNGPVRGQSLGLLGPTGQECELNAMRQKSPYGVLYTHASFVLCNMTSGCLGQHRAGPSLMFRGIYICGVMSMGIKARVSTFFFCNFAIL